VTMIREGTRTSSLTFVLLPIRNIGFGDWLIGKNTSGTGLERTALARRKMAGRCRNTTRQAKYVESNIAARSCINCWSEQEKSITYSEFVFVALVIRMKCACAVF